MLFLAPSKRRPTILKGVEEPILQSCAVLTETLAVAIVSRACKLPHEEMPVCHP